MVKKGQKTRFFELFLKIKSLVLSVIRVKWMFLWSFNILRKLHAWGKNLVLKLEPKMAQYSLIVIISLVDWYLTLIFGM